MTDGWFWSTPEWAAYLRAYGPHELHTGSANLVVRLGPQKEMWGHITKGHRADIGAARRIGLKASDVSNGVGFETYAVLHAARATRPRSRETYDAQWQSVLLGHARVYVTALREVAVGAAFFYVYGEGSYYASVARGDDAPRGTNHALVWAAMRDLAARGCRWIDMGPLHEADSEKEKSIAHFKRGFGAEEIRDWRWKLEPQGI